MPETPTLVLTSFEDGSAMIEVAYGDRRARLELDLLEDRYPGQPTAERVRQEIGDLAQALLAWRNDPNATLASA
jgi:hypothetical protein